MAERMSKWDALINTYNLITKYSVNDINMLNEVISMYSQARYLLWVVLTWEDKLNIHFMENEYESYVQEFV